MENIYTPSFAKGFAEYIDGFVKELSEKITKPDRKVIEIGSSNGYLLGKLQERGWNVLGVEPSEGLCATANENGIQTYHGFFSLSTAEEIKSIIGQPDVLIFRHVMEHMDNLQDIIKAIRNVIGNGLLLIEVPYLKRIISEDQFYAFFHEHLSYYSVTAIDRLLGYEGLHIHKVVENDLEGGSILCLANADERLDSEDNVQKYLDDEKISLSEEEIEKFTSRINKSIDGIKNTVSESKAHKQSVAAWGAGQRGCTLISICGFQSDDIAYVIDVNRNYWNKYIPGTDIRIVPKEYYKESNVNKIIIFATGYADSIIAENKDFTDYGGEFVKII